MGSAFLPGWVSWVSEGGSGGGGGGALNLVQSLARTVRIGLMQCFCSLAELYSASETVQYQHRARAFPAGQGTAQ